MIDVQVRSSPSTPSTPAVARRPTGAGPAPPPSDATTVPAPRQAAAGTAPRETSATPARRETTAAPARHATATVPAASDAAAPHDVAPVPAPRGPGAGDPMLWRRKVRHDIRHELGTIIMLAAAVAVSDDVGPASRERIEALLGETRWLDHLIRQLDEDDVTAPAAGPERVRVDELVGDLVAGLRLSSRLRIGCTARPACAHVAPLALWRAVRNVLDNACRMAGGRVDVCVRTAGGWIVVQVDDDGPGFGAGSGGLASLGLDIVHDLVSEYGGRLETGRGELGGARVRVLLPAAERP